MENLKGKKFIASYSGGKDSTLAVYKAISQGMIPIEMFTTYNIDRKRSWFHGIPQAILDRISLETDIPVSLIKTSGDEYMKNLEKKLREAKEKGVEYCVFGDIDLQGHLDWCTERCENVGIKAYFPLWNRPRKEVVYDFIDSGFETIITIVDTERMSDEFLGKVLTREVADAIEKSGVDICGENGEYHTFAYNGPLFKNPVQFSIGEWIRDGKHAIIPLIE